MEHINMVKACAGKGEPDLESGLPEESGDEPTRPAQSVSKQPLMQRRSQDMPGRGPHQFNCLKSSTAHVLL